MSERIERQLAVLAALPAGWADPDSPSISIAAMDTARALSEIAEPLQICPLSDGGLQLLWTHGDTELEVEVGADGVVGNYLASWTRNGATSGDCADPATWEQAVAAIRRTLGVEP
jgi:hypothetical protein